MTWSKRASARPSTACRRSNERRACGPIPPATRLPSGPLPVSPAVNSTRDGLTLTPGMKPRPLSSGRSARMSRRSIPSSLGEDRSEKTGRYEATGASAGAILRPKTRPVKVLDPRAFASIIETLQEAAMNRRTIGRTAIVTFVLVVLAACSTTTEQGTVGVQRSQLLLVSSAELDKEA